MAIVQISPSLSVSLFLLLFSLLVCFHISYGYRADLVFL